MRLNVMEFGRFMLFANGRASPNRFSFIIAPQQSHPTVPSVLRIYPINEGVKTGPVSALAKKKQIAFLPPA